MRRGWIAVLLVAVGGCAGSAQTSRQPVTAPVVEVPDIELRALLLLLVDRQTWEPFTVEQARAAGPAVRRELAVTLGRVGDPRALPVLQELAVDAAPEVRRAAVFALGQIAERGPDRGGERALLRAVGDADRETGALAVEALARLGERLAVAVSAGQGLAPAELEARLLPALWRFAGREVVAWAERGLARAEPELRRRAAFALAREPRPEGAPALRALLADGDPVIRAWAARALGRVGDAADLERLRPLLDDPHPGPAIRALGAATRLVATGVAAPPDGWRRPLLGLLDAPHRGVRLAAIEATAGWLLDEELGGRLAAIADGGAEAERRAALVALAVGGDPRAERQTLAAASSALAGDRAAAATAAGLLGDLELAARLFEDPEPVVRQAALAVLVEEEGARQPTLTAALADRDPGVRAAALEWLAGEPRVEVIRLLGALDGERRAGELPALPLAAMRAISARARARPAELEAAVFALERYAGGDSWLLRRAAADALAELGRARPPVGGVESDRRAADYQQMLRRTWRPREVELRTAQGTVRLRLSCRDAPLHCLNFLQLVEAGFYDGLAFHRVAPDFVVQGGDPRGDGRGGPGYTIRDEIGAARFAGGTLGMALAGADTGGSQFFVTLSPQPHLEGLFTAFGRVVAGHEVLERIGAGDRILAMTEVAGPPAR